MYCIKCGNKILYGGMGWICEHCNLTWERKDLKDNQEWAVRHIRTLESDNQAMKEQIGGLMQQNVDLATKLELLISTLEKSMGVDLNNDGTIPT